MNANLLAASNLAIVDALVISAMGFAMVFAVLVILMIIIKIMGIVSEKSPAIAAKLPKINLKKKETVVPVVEEAIKEESPKAIGTCGELVLINTEERDAAMIMAIVADEMGTPLNELRFKSIKKIEGEE